MCIAAYVSIARHGTRTRYRSSRPKKPASRRDGTWLVIPSRPIGANGRWIGSCSFRNPREGGSKRERERARERESKRAREREHERARARERTSIAEIDVSDKRVSVTSLTLQDYPRSACGCADFKSRSDRTCKPSSVAPLGAHACFSCTLCAPLPSAYTCAGLINRCAYDSFDCAPIG